MLQSLRPLYKNLALFGNPRFYRALPAFLVRNSVQSDVACLYAAVDWLLLSNHVCDGYGFSGTYSFYKGWGPAYLETTGYIIPTLYSFLQLYNYRRDEILQSIRSSGQFLLWRQFQDGSYSNSSSPDPYVFDTGQVIFGLLALYQHEREEQYLQAARRAGNWLCEQQSPAGCWIKHTYNSIPHTYYTRVSWALAELANKTGEQRFRDFALRQLRWAVTQQQPNGWFRFSSFYSDNKAVLHTIAYTIEGLWKSAPLMGENSISESAVLAAQAMALIQKRDRVLLGYYGSDWNPMSGSRCLTGLCQMALVWLEMGKAGIGHQFIEAAEVALRFVKRQQLTGPSDAPWRGALMGSTPPWGNYMPWTIPNWVFKFFIDALLLKQATSSQ